MTTLLLPYIIAASCNTFSIQCVCYPAVPFEGFQMYVTEKCDGSESSYRYGQQVYDSMELCEAEIAEDANCQSLL